MSTDNGDSGFVVSQNEEEEEEDDALLNERERLAQRCVRLEAQISALKEVSSLRKSLLDLRENEMKELIVKLKIFEEAIAQEKETRQDISCRVETAEQRCLELTSKLQTNVDNLSAMKTSYEDKISQLARELEKSDEDYQKRTDELNDSELRNIHLQSRVDETNSLICDNEVLMKKMREEMRVLVDRNRAFAYQMNLLNTLFNEIEGTPIDFDRIRAIGDIVRESQNNQNGDFSTASSSSSSSTSTSAAAASSPPAPESPNTQNLSPSRRASLDFRTLIDHIDMDKFTEDIPGEESCYKKVATVHGPQLVLSVSQTFIKLKDLILEKKSLQREIESLKHLNSKLESKVDRQERRLFTVTTELNKTWNLVAKLKVQHDKLHTSEAVLKYELHEKRKMLERLKHELSRSRQQWVKVRQKNECAELECKRMRAEFARRRQASSPASQESGAFSESSTDDVENDIDEAGTSRGHSLVVVHNDQKNHEDCSTMEIEEEGEEEEEEGVDPLEELVSDLVEEIEAVTSSVENESNAEGSNGTDDGTSDTNRANRLRRLEEASTVLYRRLMATTVQSSALASRLAQLHTQYGSHDGVPLETEAFEYDEITVGTESSGDVAYASALQNNNNTADDTEIDSQFDEFATPSIANVANDTIAGSVEMLYDDDDVEGEEQVREELMPAVNFQEDEDDEDSPNVILPPPPSPLLERPATRLPITVMATTATMTNAAEVLVVEVEMGNEESFTELASVSQVNQVVADDDDDHRQSSSLSGLLLSATTATTTPIYDDDRRGTTVVLDSETEPETQNTSHSRNNTDRADSPSSSSSSPDPNSLSRLIIQQVPKRLEILKLQNSSMKDREQYLKAEMEKQKFRVETLELENARISQQLDAEIRSKEEAIASLSKEIDNLVQTMNREKETLATFMKNYTDEKTELDSTNKSSNKKCSHCGKKVSRGLPCTIL